ncbi:Hypothetical protein ABZS17G119_02430 [Kosakonia cowanii]
MTIKGLIFRRLVFNLSGYFQTIRIRASAAAGAFSGAAYA